MQSAHFENIGNQIISLINKANNEITIAMAWFTNNDIFESLLSCLDRNIKVEILLLDDAINKLPYAPDFNEFIRRGGIFRILKKEEGFLHHKFCVIDNIITITGSYNWTYYAETRNHENVLVIENKDISNSYISEFMKLNIKIKPLEKYQQLSWEEIEHIPEVDFDALNFEIKNIAIVKHLPQRKIVKSTTQIEIIEKRFAPIASQNIGFMYSEDGIDDYIFPIIEKGSKLPCIKSKTSYSYKEFREYLTCNLFYGISKRASECKPLLRENISSLTEGRDDEELRIQIQMTLNSNGYLHVEVKCIETGKALDLTTTNMELIDYGN